MENSSLVTFLGELPIFRVLRSLMVCTKPRHLREIARLSDLSPSGVLDILRRLKDLKVLAQSRSKNRICYQLNIKANENAWLTEFLTNYERALIASRATQFNRIARKRLKWMDEAHGFYRQRKKFKWGN